ncbi:hypothetical protein [Pseudofrankia inefficax]|uniref:DUF218 domain-containing protein n=1 Tax=Pseudofrankia inefficax (strain DSM 45817 / CECT 9037 / DDB 130130 / EuI1c) TaxID=298654 RepID=E3J4V6_PSEI1|nr:hypothetical protein [Pseudofrankia inefficax]ADP78275.1 protein of unknown function DUF218 [Pseudofrankia inefficax]
MTDRAAAAVGPQPTEPDESGEPPKPAVANGATAPAVEDGVAEPEPAPAVERAGIFRRFRRLRRGWLVVVGLVLVLVVGLLAATLRLFVFPKADSLTKADAIVMFDGIGGRKYTTFWLAGHGYAPVVAVSTQDLTFCQKSLPTISGVQVFCFVPTPATTRGEAEATERLATEHGWKKVIVVTGRPQETRARIRVERCYQGQVEIKGVSPGRDNWPKTIVYEWGALIKALVFQRSC